MEERIVRREGRRGSRRPKARTALIAGVPGSRTTATALPIDIVGEDQPESIVVGPSGIHLVSVDELRDGTIGIEEVIGR